LSRGARLCAIAALATATAYADGVNSNELTEVVVADEIRTAFYEQAPRTLAAAMYKAVSSWCSTADRHRIADAGGANAETVGWLCGSQKLHYFRSVYITGEKGSHGLTCENKYKYMGVDMVNESIEHGSCVPAELDSDEKTYQLYFENKRTGSEP
jgi:hypothetical protein